ncbi:MAG TPA: hypothetical protein VJ866_14745 [Pyrinomonadaceae bacterium]|nr:hypothetical protein [Pyrinomonadaceae bacterium]
MHDCGTVGDWAGSLVINLAEGTAAGMHVAGFLDRVCFGVSSAALLKAMGVLGLTTALPPQPEADEDDDGFEARRRRPEDYADRQPVSYREDFLGVPVPLPTLEESIREDVVTYEGPDGVKTNVLPCTHFSMMMSRSRKMCFYTACNLHGEELIHIVRGGDT